MRSTEDSKPKTARELGIMQGFPPPPEKRPSLENWDLAPFNRWSFQNIRSLFPTVDVRRGNAEPKKIQQNLTSLNEIPFTKSSGNLTNIGRWLDDSYTDAFLVAHEGKILCEHYSNGMSAETPHLSQSISKSLVGAVAAILIEEGVLDTNAPLIEYIPELSVCGYADASLRDVLDMRSGVKFTEDYGIPNSDMTRLDIASGWRPPRRGEIRPSIHDIILSLPKERDHGGMFSYRSIETEVVAWVLERVTGDSLANLISDKIWSKLGCEHDAFFTVDEEGTALADGGFTATLRDFARFGELIRNNGCVGDTQVIPNLWIDQLFTECDSSAHGNPYNILSPNGAYRNFWWIHEPEQRKFMARGVFGQLIYIDQLNDVVVVKLSTWPDYLIPAYSSDAIKAVDAIVQTVGS